MTSFARFGPAILESRCCNYGKGLAVIVRGISEGGREDSSKKNRPMVTAAELDLQQAQVDSNSNIRTTFEDATAIDTDEFAEPTTCCMSGCANCVWIQYAEMLSVKLNKLNSNEDVQKIIMEKVQDPNMRAFLSMELRCRNIVKS